MFYVRTTLSVKRFPLFPQNRSGEAGTTPILDAASDLADISLWTAAWKVWVNIGTNATIPPEKPEARGSGKVYVPSQSFLTALLLTFPPLFQHTKGRFAATDLQQFSRVLHAALSVPVHGDASPFIIPSYPDVTITPLQDASLQAMDCLVKVEVLFFRFAVFFLLIIRFVGIILCPKMFKE